VRDHVVEVFAATLDVDPSSLNDDSSPDNTAMWDSTAAMALVAGIEERFNIELTTREISAMRTIGLVREVLRRKGVQGV
jgi:acyl carrier protein